MPLILHILQHSPEDCPLNNEKVKKLSVVFMSKMGQHTKKHGIKVVGAWHSAADHTVVMVWDVPSIEAWQKFNMEPEVLDLMAYNTSEIKLVTTLEEAMKIYMK